MANVHGKNTEFVLDVDDISEYCNGCDLERSADSHDVTTYGNNSHRKSGGLYDGKATVTGFYDNTAATGPRAVIEPLIGTIVPFEHRPEGTGVGRPERTGQCLVVRYAESAPVADMVTFTLDIEFDGDVTVGVQA